MMKFRTWLTPPPGSGWLRELAKGSCSGLLLFTLIVFASPPLPFYNLHCGTGYNDPAILPFTLLLLAARLRLGRNKRPASGCA